MTDKGAPSQQSDFIFVESKVVEEKRRKGYGRGTETIPYEPKKEEAEWISKSVNEQISSTISSIQEKELKDVENVYIVLGISKRLSDSDTVTVLKSLSAEVLAYLNETHTKLLVSCPLSKLSAVLRNATYASKYFQQVKRISPLMFEEQVSEYLREDIEWPSKARPLLIRLVPNISEDKRQHYLKAIIKHLKEIQAKLLDYEMGFLLADLDLSSTRKLLQVSNYIFDIGGVPQGVIERVPDSVEKKRLRSRRIRSIVADVSSVVDGASGRKELPTICLMDSGVNEIPPLDGLVVVKDGVPTFSDFDDGRSPQGHGTPIACLATYGEELSEPKAKIISYKVYADDLQNVVFQGMFQAISKYSQQTRIFLSSINFDRDHPQSTSELDRLTQERNICLVFSAGNILPKTVLNCIATGSSYPSYIPNYPVKSPTQAVSIMAVGAISKRDSHITIARRSELAPFSRCGTRNPFLYDCPKPEVVQNGGNLCHDGSTSGVGVDSFDKNGAREGFVGTSFSAPLYARGLAEIEAKYGNRIRNAETLKAITLASCNSGVQNCMGFGETRSFCSCDRFHALVVSEGTLSLPDSSRPSESLHYKAEISVKIPKFIEKLEVFVVHSDNHAVTPVPSLNTYLKVYARKTGHEIGTVSLDNREELGKKSHMKVFRWAFKKKSMEGDWTFVIRPETTAEITEQHRRRTRIRYGCAILVSSKSTSVYGTLSNEMRGLLGQR